MTTPVPMIAPFPEAPSRANPDGFAAKGDAFFDHLKSTFEPQINASIAVINDATASVDIKSIQVETAHSEVMSAKQQIETTLATIPEGTINDLIISQTDAWSSSKTAQEIAAGQSIETITMTKDHEVNLTLPTGEYVAGIYRMGNREVFVTTNGYIAVYDIATKTFGAFTLARDTVVFKYFKYDDDTLVIFQGSGSSITLYATVITFTGTTVNVGTRYSVTLPANVYSPIQFVGKVGSSILIGTQYTVTGNTNSYFVAMTLSGSVVTFGSVTTISHIAGQLCRTFTTTDRFVTAYKNGSTTSLEMKVFTVSGTTITSVGATGFITESGDYMTLPVIHNGYAITLNNTKAHYVPIATGTGGGTITITTASTNATTFLFIKNGNSIAFCFSSAIILFSVNGGVTYTGSYTGGGAAPLELSESKVVFGNTPTFTVAEIDTSGVLSVTRKLVLKTDLGTAAYPQSGFYSTDALYDIAYKTSFSIVRKSGSYLIKGNRSSNILPYKFDGNNFSPYLFDRDYSIQSVLYSTDSFWEIVQEQLIGSSLVNFKRFV